jgi:hypothetical protein
MNEHNTTLITRVMNNKKTHWTRVPFETRTWSGMKSKKMRKGWNNVIVDIQNVSPSCYYLHICKTHIKTVC